MIEFLYSYILLLLLVPLVLFFYILRKKQTTLDTIFSKEMLKELRFHSEFISSKLRYRLFLLSLSLMVLALARPVIEQENLNIKEKKNNLVIAVDMSKSMEKTDIYPSRKELAKQKLLHILELADGFSVGVLFYAKDAYMVYPLSEDRVAIHTILKNSQTQMQFAPNSNLFAALEASNFMLKDASLKNIMLLSDGGMNTSHLEELKYLKKHRLHLYSLTITKDKTPKLENLANQSGGEGLRYTWGDRDIEELLKSINTQVKEQMSRNIELKNYNEYFFYPLVLALVLLVLSYQPSLKFTKFLLLACFLSISTPKNLHAGVLDFWKLKKASEYYENAEYKNATIEYEKVATNPSTYYNYANALYKSKEYLQAIKFYKKALSEDKVLNAKIYHNIANAQLKRDKLDTAKVYFLKALQEHKFPQTQENLALVIKELQRRKKLLHKDGLKIKFKNSLKENEELYHTSSTYSIKLEKLLLSEEEKWMKLINKQQSPLFLQKIPTSRRSADADKLY